MDKKTVFQEWRQFAKMDLDTAIHLCKTMHPRPLEIICYHCQQSAEKCLKAVLVWHETEIKRTHDLGLLAELCSTYIEIPESIYDDCDLLTPYGIKIRYPQELFLEDHHAKAALQAAQEIFQWLDQIKFL